MFTTDVVAFGLLRGLVTSSAAVAQKLATDAQVTLFQLDLTKLGGDVIFWTNNTNLGTEVSFGGQIYTPIDMQWEGYERKAKGAVARPKVRVSNVSNGGTALLQQYNGLIGATLTKIKVFARFLDSGSDPDPGQVLQVDIYKVSRKSAQNQLFIEWELRAAVDIEGTQLPKRQLVRTCQARYRRWNAATASFDYDTTSAACPYTGSQAYDLFDRLTTQDKDVASKHLSCCQARFGKTGKLPFHGFPGAGRVK
jgi:lambda family phage minor tail protein L